MNIAILTPDPFPIGNVATHRLMTYGKELAKTDKVIVLVLKSTEIAGRVVNGSTKGIAQGISYQYMSATTIWDTTASIFSKGIVYFGGIVRTLVTLSKESINTIILYSSDPIYFLVFGLYARIFGKAIFIDRSEFPSFVQTRGALLYRVCYLAGFKLFDGVIVMTTELARYYSKIVSTGARLFILPMSVDTGRFNSITTPLTLPPFFACVFGVHNRDCVLDTIRAFEIFCNKGKHPHVMLKLIGDLENLKDGKKAQGYLIERPELAKRIVLTGPVVSSEVPQLITDSLGLVTTPRHFPSGGFPSKLGEYLATGRPIITTRVGEIENYLIHGRHCLISNPGDVEQVAEFMEWVAEDSERWVDMGRQGAELARTVFNVKTYLGELRKFLDSGRGLMNDS